MAADVRLPPSGQQADVHHALSSNPVQRHQRHAALLWAGDHWTDGHRHHRVRDSVHHMI